MKTTLIVVTLESFIPDVPPSVLLYNKMPTVDAIKASYKESFTRIIDALAEGRVTSDQAHAATIFRDSIDRVLACKPAHADESVIVFDGGDYAISIMGQETEDDAPTTDVPKMADIERQWLEFMQGKSDNEVINLALGEFHMAKTMTFVHAAGKLAYEAYKRQQTLMLHDQIAEVIAKADPRALESRYTVIDRGELENWQNLEKACTEVALERMTPEQRERLRAALAPIREL